MPDLNFFIKVSRPRFWLYVLGPYVVGLAAGAPDRASLLGFAAIAFTIYFLFPANLLIYGINDIFDFETDKLNPKKEEYEILVQPADRKKLLTAALALNLPFLIAAFFLPSAALASILCFLFFSFFYSAPPLRAKAVPVVDSIFNVLYVFPGIFGYVIVAGEFPPILPLISAFLWTMAMHAYSAIPDIRSDKAAGVETIATFIGRNGTMLFCSACYLLSAVLAFPYLGVLAGILGIMYLTLIALSLFARNSEGIFRIYKYFPLVNSIAGFFLFWYVAYLNLIAAKS